MDVESENPELEVAAGHTLSDSSAPMAPLNPNTVADALEQRIQQQRQQQLDQSTAQNYIAFDEDHEKRQEFRRMIDPGILRPNARPLALESLKVYQILIVLRKTRLSIVLVTQTLLTLAENILKHPNEEKYQKFKPTNSNIKRLLVDPKGTIEYARAVSSECRLLHNYAAYTHEISWTDGIQSRGTPTVSTARSKYLN